MGDINSFAIQQAEVAAARLWAFGSAPYPISGGALIQRHIEQGPRIPQLLSLSTFGEFWTTRPYAPNSCLVDHSAFGPQQMV